MKISFWGIKRKKPMGVIFIINTLKLNNITCICLAGTKRIQAHSHTHTVTHTHTHTTQSTDNSFVFSALCFLIRLGMIGDMCSFSLLSFEIISKFWFKKKKNTHTHTHTQPRKFIKRRTYTP